MTRKLFVPAIVFLTALPCSASAAEFVKVRLYVEGAYWMGCAGVITDALAGSGVQNLSKIPPNKGRGYVIVSGDVPDGELGKLADAVNKALTPHRAKVQPLVSLELVAKLDNDSAEAAIKALKAVEGVDADNSNADTDRGMLAVRLAGDKPVSVATITAALAKAGVEAKIATPPAEPKAAEETKDKAAN